MSGAACLHQRHHGLRPGEASTRGWPGPGAWMLVVSPGLFLAAQSTLRHGNPSKKMARGGGMQRFHAHTSHRPYGRRSRASLPASLWPPWPHLSAEPPEWLPEKQPGRQVWLMGGDPQFLKAHRHKTPVEAGFPGNLDDLRLPPLHLGRALILAMQHSSPE